MVAGWLQGDSELSEDERSGVNLGADSWSELLKLIGGETNHAKEVGKWLQGDSELSENQQGVLDLSQEVWSELADLKTGNTRASLLASWLHGDSELSESQRNKVDLSADVWAELAGVLEIAGLETKENATEKVNKWLGSNSDLSESQRQKLEILQGKFPYHSELKGGNFRFIDLFAGIGGIRIPFQELGGECVFTSEWDKFAKRTYFGNFGDYPAGDIRKIDVTDIPEHEVLLAGFPCQAFSQAGLKRGFSDTRGTLFFEIQRIVRHHAPKAILLENVKRLETHDQGRTLKTILSVLRGETIDQSIEEHLRDRANYVHDKEAPVTYHVGYKVLKARDFGVPQNRERIYIVALRDDLFDADAVPTIFEGAIGSATPSDKLGSVLMDNSAVDPKYTISDRLWDGHVNRREAYRDKGHGFGYGLFDRESPYCNTISARYYKDGGEILIDQSDISSNPRMLTPRECARIQGFPEEYEISHVTDVQLYKQFGNSVAIPVIRQLAAEIISTLQNDYSV
ncbi:MAG: DNA (cytosine-5-)-methyltransferase [Planctomycetaceae bacterium]|nr:DNA (cytosine-5-)-methyltransferase [Planctomycetaceae bacterium]